MIKADCGHQAPDDVEVLVDDEGKEYRYCAGCQPVIAGAYGLKPKPKPAPKQFKPQLDTKDVRPPVELPKTTVEHVTESMGLHLAVKPAEVEASDPWQEGRTAYFAGQNEAENPYDRRKKEGRDWQRGFTEAREVAE